MSKSIKYRPATPGDSRFIAEMIDLSSDGIAAIEWHEKAEQYANLNPIDVGMQAYAQDEGDYSYRNAIIAERGRRPIGMILAFPITAENRTPYPKPPPYGKADLYAPYGYLEAVDSWYICGLAVVPEYRRQGVASILMEMSMQMGRERGFKNTSLIAMLQKTRLIKYYEARGFEITRSAPIVDHPLIRVSGIAVLMETLPFR